MEGNRKTNLRENDMKLKNFIKYPSSLGALFGHRRHKEALTPAQNQELVDLGHALDVEFYTDPCQYVKGEYNTHIMRNGEEVMFYVVDPLHALWTLRLTSGKSPEESESEMVQYLMNHTTSLHTERETFRFPVHTSMEELRMRISVMGTALWSAKTY